MSLVGAERVPWRGVGNFILRVIRSSLFVQTILTIHYTTCKLTKKKPFYTFRSPIDADNRNLVVVQCKRDRQLSQLHISYTSYTYFFTRDPLRWISDMSCSSRTPSSTSTTATWWSITSQFVIKVKLKYCTCFMSNCSWRIHRHRSQTDMSDPARHFNPITPSSTSTMSTRWSPISELAVATNKNWWWFSFTSYFEKGPRYIKPVYSTQKHQQCW